MDGLLSVPTLIFLIPIVAIVGGIGAGVIKMITSAIQRQAEVREREQSRRDIAAYIAEGSMTPEDGERLLRAGSIPPPRD